jgi:Putative lumazine-binding
VRAVIRSSSLLIILLAAGAAARLQAQAGSARDSSAAAAVVTDYLQGLQFNDTLRLAKAFWPSTKLLWVKGDGTLGELTQPAWYASFRGSVGQRVEGTLKMVKLEITGSAASAKVVEDYPDSRYTDYLGLLRIQGRWWIVSKLYVAEHRSGKSDG